MGRHARDLAAAGYTVIGVERDAMALATARAQAGGPVYVQADVRDYRPEPAAFDAVIVMSQSFGYFDADTNRALLSRLGEALRPAGRLILDLWNPEFFLTRQGRRTLEMTAGPVRETTRMADGRLFSRLDYPDGSHDVFEWQTFLLAEMVSLARSVGLTLAMTCTGYAAGVAPSVDQPRVQFVLERHCIVTPAIL